MFTDGIIDQLEKQLLLLECDHPKKIIRYREASNSTRMYKSQCTRCGELLGNWIPHKDISNKESIEPFDDRLQETYRKTVIDLEKEINQRKFELQQPSVLETYYDYLSSDDWKAKRLLVLDRCNYICEGCGIKRASQVHHLTYRNIGNEFLFELKGLCSDCHKRLHPDKVQP